MPPSAASAEAAGEGAVPPLLELPPKISRISLPTLFKKPDRSQAAGEHNINRPAKTAAGRIGSDLRDDGGARKSGGQILTVFSLQKCKSGLQRPLRLLLLLHHSNRVK